MKQMRSRFRLLTLLLACAFLLTLVLCAGKTLKTAGITLDTLLSPTAASGTPQPDSSVTPDPWFGAITVTDAPDTTPAGSEPPGTDNPPPAEYNLFGL